MRRAVQWPRPLIDTGLVERPVRQRRVSRAKVKNGKSGRRKVGALSTTKARHRPVVHAAAPPSTKLAKGKVHVIDQTFADFDSFLHDTQEVHRVGPVPEPVLQHASSAASDAREMSSMHASTDSPDVLHRIIELKRFAATFLRENQHKMDEEQRRTFLQDLKNSIEALRSGADTKAGELKRDPSSTDDLKLQSDLMMAETRVLLERERDDQVAVAVEAMQKDRDETQRQIKLQKDQEVKEAIAEAEASLRKRHSAIVADLEVSSRKSLSSQVKVMRTMMAEQTDAARRSIDCEFKVRVDELEHELREQHELTIERSKADMEAKWTKQRELKVIHLQKEFADAKLASIRAAHDEYEKLVAADVNQMRAQADADLKACLSTVNEELDNKRKTRIACVRLELESRRIQDIRELEEQLISACEQEVSSITKELNKLRDEELHVVRSRMARTSKESIERLHETAKAGRAEAVQKLKASLENDMLLKESEERRRLELERVAELNRLQSNHASSLAQAISSISKEFINQSDDDRVELETEMTADRSLLDKVRTFAQRSSRLANELRMSRQTKEDHQACRTCQKLLAYNAEILSRAQRESVSNGLDPMD